MKTAQNAGQFEKVGACLYRYKPSGVYYARIKKKGKEIRHSLETRDKIVAKAKLAEKHKELDSVDPALGKITVNELCERYLRMIQHRKPNTIQSKEAVIKRVRSKWPAGKSQQVKDAKPSDVLSLLSKQGSRMGKSSYNQYLSAVREMFALAANDRIIAQSPSADPVCCARSLRCWLLMIGSLHNHRQRAANI